MRFRLPSVAAVLALSLAAPLAAVAQDFQWHGAIPQGGTIEIRGVNGDIRAEPSGGNDVEVVAEKHARRSDVSTVQIQVVADGSHVTICAVYPTVEGQLANECRAGGGRMNVRDNDVSVRFTVRVPANVQLRANTVNGDVDASRLNGDLALSTVNGSVTFATTGSARATTVNGSIHGEMGRADWADEAKFSTVNGSIVLTLPADLSAEIKAGTVNGDISTDFPMTVTGRVSRRRLDGTIGGGGRTLALDTVNGSVTLKRQ